MKKRIWPYFFGLLGILLLSKCVEPFELPSAVADSDFLVVEGFVNVDEGISRIVLSRSQGLGVEVGPARESRAKVLVETEQRESFQLYETEPGLYQVSGLQLHYGTPYRLRIETSGGKAYVSAFVSTQKTPEIDSVTWSVSQGGVQVAVNTHDPANSTRYYKWDYEEVYEYSAYFNSQFVYRYGEVITRPQNESIYRCWRTDASKAIHVGTTVQLSQDVVRNFPLVYHLGNSVQFGRKYSILVKQYGLSKNEYEYWQMLKKNTESVGSIFDAQPSQVTGNITCLTNPSEPVLGYFSARSVTSRRMFIDPMVLRKKYNLFYHEVPTCLTDTARLRDLPEFVEMGRVIVEELLPPASGYVLASPACADCRTAGGTTAMPAYWE